MTTNNITGDKLINNKGNHSLYSDNFDKIGSPLQYTPPETRYPVSITLPKELFKKIQIIAENKGTTVTQFIQEDVNSIYNDL